jgi:methyl-accepting chemotaxis protein
MSDEMERGTGIGRMIALACSVLIFLTLSIAALGVFSMGSVRDAARAVLDRAMPYQSVLQSADRTLANAHTSCISLLFLSPKSPRFAELGNARTSEIQSAREQIGKLTKLSSSDTQSQAIQELKSRVDALDAEQREIIDILLEDTAEARRDAIDQTLGSCAQVFGSVRASVDVLESEAMAVADRSAQATDESIQRSEHWLIGGSLIAIVLSILITVVFTRSIRGPIVETVDLLREMSSGDADLTRRLPVTRSDELGDLSRAFNAFVERQQNMIRQLIQQTEVLGRASYALASVGERIESAARRTADRTIEVGTGTQHIQESLESTARGATTVAENMNAVRESAEGGALRTKLAVDSAIKASETMMSLTNSSQEIGGVVKVISSIAEQTNLLALNATIEAARAGELGKGFAVVATEVKELAKGSSAATVDIDHRIQAVRMESEQAQAAIGEVRTVMDELSLVVSSFAETACAQDEECRSIATSVAKIAKSAESISTTVKDLESIAQEGAACAVEARGASNDLSAISKQIAQLVGRFRCS